MTRFLPVLALAAALAGCGPSADETARQPAAPAPTEAAKPDPAQLVAELDKLYVDFWEESLKLNPLRATNVGDPRYNAELPNTLSAEYRQQTHDFNQRWLDRAKAIDPSALDGQARISYDIFVRNLEMELEGERFPGWQQPFNQFSSFPNMLALLGSGSNAQPFKTVKDYDDWLARAGKAPTIFDQAIANMREGITSGVVQPKVLMEKVIPQLDALIKDKPEHTTFWKPIETLPKDFSDADRQRLSDAYRKLIAEQLMPAYTRLRDFIKHDYLPAARDTVTLSALPDGEAWYAYNVRRRTTTDLSPAQIHEIGLEQVERIHGEMRELIQGLDFEGELQDFFKFVATDPQFEFKDEQTLLDAYNAFGKSLEPSLDKLFSLQPKASFEIRPVEAFRSKSAAGGSYQRPSEDGTRAGIFYVNTYDLPTRKTWDVESLYLHEAKPGHHFQLALQQELTDLPKFRRFGGETAFSEGWGLYAESLGKQLGAYTDPYQYFGRLQAELWRAIRLVVDTGVHSKGWSREQVIDYMLDNSAESETSSISEAERYIAVPGQALAYKIGELKILELRKKAQTALGDRFDIRAFHAEVLKDGSVPLSVLESKIDRWLTSQR